MSLITNLAKVISLYGPRRCGKTTLFYQTIKVLQEAKVPAENILYFNFEDERILPFRKEDWDLLLEAHKELYPQTADQTVYLFLDEIQEADMWDKFVRRVSELGQYRLFLTGSSSKLMSREIATSLRGRTLSYFLTPFSFGEFLRFKKMKLGVHWEYSSQVYKIKQLFQEYLEFGGFPEVFQQPESLKIQILQGYFDLIFYKDIVERYRIRNLILLKELMRHLVTNFASLFSMTGYYKYLKSSGRKISKDAVGEYLAAMEDANFIKLIPLFDFSLKRQALNPKKAYCIDNGMITAASFQFTENRGRYLENLVFLELLRQGREIYYFKDAKGREVDFLITAKGRPRRLIQVCEALSNSRTRDREVDALISAATQLKVKELWILTADKKDQFRVGNHTIHLEPVWSWLLRKPLSL